MRAEWEVEGRLGVATDGERCYVSGSKAFYVYAKDGVDSNMQVAVCDTESLACVRSIPWNPDAGQVEVRAVAVAVAVAIAVDPSSGSFLCVPADDGDAEADPREHVKLWRMKAETKATAVFVSQEGTFDDLRFPAEIEGLDFDDAAGERIVLANRGKRIVLGMPKGLCPGYDREVHEIHVSAIR